MKCGRLDSKQLNSPAIVSRSLVYAIILCHYDLFSSLSLLHSFQCLLVYRSCGDCPRNETACLADHCVSADGQRRGILTANRQMPGPTIQVSSSQSFHYSLGLFINELTHSFFRQIFFQKSFYFSLHNFHRINNSRNCYNSSSILIKDFRQESFVSRWTVVMFGVQVCENDILVVDVINRLPGKAAAIHWRGQSQLETPYMDGSPLVTQCPIPSYTTFQYKFRASAAGTHLWHAHAGN